MSKESDERCEKSVSEKPRELSQKSLSIERSDSTHEICQPGDEQIGISTSLKDEVKDSAQSRQIREIGDVRTQIEGALSTLTPPIPSEETSSKTIDDKRLLQKSITLSASKEENIDIDLRQQKYDQSGEISQDKPISETLTTDLEGRAPEYREIDANIGLSDQQPHDLIADSLQKSSSKDRIEAGMNESGEEAIHGFWKTVEGESASTQIIGSGLSELMKDQLSMKASQEDVTSLDQTLNKISDEGQEKIISERSKEFGQKSLSIEKVDSSHEIKPPQEEQLGSSASVKDLIKDSVQSIQIREMGDVSTQVEEALSTLTSPTQSEETSSKIIDDRRLLQESLSASESKEENIDLNLRQQLYDQARSVSQEKQLTEMQKTDLESTASEYRELSANIDFTSELPSDMQVEGLRKSPSTELLSATMKTPSEENVQGIWNIVESGSEVKPILQEGQVSDQMPSDQTVSRVLRDEHHEIILDDQAKERQQKSLSVERFESQLEIKQTQAEATSAGLRKIIINRPGRKFG